MKLAASLVAVALIASPALAQDNTTSATVAHVHTTTRHIHATNVPVHRATHRRVIHHRAKHHVMRCTRVTRHGKTYCAKTHHVVVKKRVTTTVTHS
jgi:hypothetical protein